jgi:hypothetical protein
VGCPRLTCKFLFPVLERRTVDTFTGTTGLSSLTIAVMRRMTRLSSGSGSVFGNGPLSASHDCYNSRLARLVSRSTDSKTFRGLMVRDASLSKNRVTLLGCRGVILASIGWTYLHIRIMKVWSKNCCLPLSTVSCVSVSSLYVDHDFSEKRKVFGWNDLSVCLATTVCWSFPHVSPCSKRISTTLNDYCPIIFYFFFNFS